MCESLCTCMYICRHLLCRMDSVCIQFHWALDFLLRDPGWGPSSRNHRIVAMSLCLRFGWFGDLWSAAEMRTSLAVQVLIRCLPKTKITVPSMKNLSLRLQGCKSWLCEPLKYVNGTILWAVWSPRVDTLEFRYSGP